MFSVHKESGIDAPNGWTVDNVHLQNEYYQALMGGIYSPTANPSTVVSNAPGWARFYLNNTGFGTRDRNYVTLTAAGTPVVMVSLLK